VSYSIHHLISRLASELHFDTLRIVIIKNKMYGSVEIILSMNERNAEIENIIRGIQDVGSLTFEQLIDISRNLFEANSLFYSHPYLRVYPHGSTLFSFRCIHFCHLYQKIKKPVLLLLHLWILLEISSNVYH
jgi:hypothetical protein